MAANSSIDLAHRLISIFASLKYFAGETPLVDEVVKMAM
jgi:hypothetical protein